MSSSIDSFSTGCADLSVASFPSSEAGRRSFAAIARDRAAGLRDGKSVIASCMPYTPLRVAADAPEILHRFVRQHIDPLLADVRFLLSIRRPDQAEKGSLQRPMGAMLLICADGAAQLLYPGKPRMREVERFKGFLLAYYPWTLDPPENLLPEQAVEILWFFYRCPIVHRFGAVHDTNPAPLINKVGNIFIGDEATLDRCEQPGERPFRGPPLCLATAELFSGPRPSIGAFGRQLSLLLMIARHGRPSSITWPLDRTPEKPRPFPGWPSQSRSGLTSTQENPAGLGAGLSDVTMGE